MAGVRGIEKKIRFISAGGANTAANRAATELMRGADPLVTWPRKCRKFEWLTEVCPWLASSQIVDGATVTGIRYSDLEIILAGVVRVGGVFKSHLFKDTFFSPELLGRVAGLLGECPDFDTATPRMSTPMLVADVVEYATRILEETDERFTAERAEDFHVLQPTLPYAAAQQSVESLTFGMLGSPEKDRLLHGAQVMSWLGCRYPPEARCGVGPELGSVLTAMLVARDIYAEKQPNKARLHNSYGGGSAFIAWMVERGQVDPRVDDVEACKSVHLMIPALIDRLRCLEWGEMEKEIFLKRRLTRLMNAFPLLKTMMGGAMDTDIARLLVLLNNSLLPTKLSRISEVAQVAQVEEALSRFE